MSNISDDLSLNNLRKKWLLIEAVDNKAAEIATLEGKIRNLQARMSSPDYAEDPEALEAIKSRIGQLNAQATALKGQVKDKADVQGLMGKGKLDPLAAEVAPEAPKADPLAPFKNLDTPAEPEGDSEVDPVLKQMGVPHSNRDPDIDFQKTKDLPPEEPGTPDENGIVVNPDGSITLDSPTQEDQGAGLSDQPPAVLDQQTSEPPQGGLSLAEDDAHLKSIASDVITYLKDFGVQDSSLIQKILELAKNLAPEAEVKEEVPAPTSVAPMPAVGGLMKESKKHDVRASFSL
jgi:hypothetical protein